MTMNEAVTETDLLAFVDGQLPPARRAEIETYLVRHPGEARRVAADLALLEGLRLLFGRPVTVPVLAGAQSDDYTSFLA